MNKLVFVVLCALLVGGALGEAALGNYYKDVVREQHKLINEMNQNFTELEKASEKLIDLGAYVGKYKLPPKTIKITKTVAVKVPVPFPVKVPEPVPVPVPVSKPVPVPVPTLVAIPVESTAATVVAVTVAGSTSGPSPSPVPADADPASSQAHASTVQVQEYVHSFPIHSVYDAGDDYNPMEGNRLALAEHTASPTESTFSKPSPSSLQQLEEYQHQYAQHHQRHTGQHSQQQKHRQHQKPTQTGSHSGAEHYYHGGHGGGGASGGQRQFYVGGAQVQAGAHSAAKFRPESHALQSAAESYDFGDGANQFHTSPLTRATDTPYSTASGISGGKSAPSAPSAIGEGYRFAGEQQQQPQQQFQRGQHGGSSFESQQYGRGGSGGGTGAGGRGGAGEPSGGRVVGADIGGVGGSDPEAGAHSYVKFSEATAIEADNQATTVPRFQSEGETRLQAGFEAGFQEGLQTTHQAGLEAGLEAGFQAGLQADQGAEKGAQHHGAGAKTKEVNDLTPRPFQAVRESYPRYEKPDFGRYHTAASGHHQHHHHHDSDRQQQGSVRGGSGSVLAEGYSHPAFAQSNRPGAATVGAAATTATHGYSVSGERTVYPKISTAGYHHSHPYPADLPGEAHKDLHHQANTAGDPFPFYHATKHDPLLAGPALKSYHSDAAAGGPSYQLQQQYGEHKESPARGTSAQTVHEFHNAGGYHTFTEHHHDQHDQFGQKHKGGYGSSAKPTVYSVPSDAHLYPSYNDHDHHHGSDNNGATHSHDHTGTGGKFHYHFHNVHPVGVGGAGSGNDHHEPAASEHQYAVHAELGQYGGVAGPDGSLVTSYDPPASGSTFHLHDDGTGDMFAGASTVQERQHRAPYEESSPYGHTH
ncbi:hornerin-like [Anopheles marshallii]|uniref:hornerin-like n=1 Tax=Anopheles marshallii TaxID=1521116 RepID=UPI00237AA979|nr:hornerin-like [Anopheles marshallii]